MLRKLIALMILLILLTPNTSSATTLSESYLYGLLWEEEEQIEPLTREDLVVRIVDLLNLDKLSPKETSTILANYSDAHLISFWTREDLAQAIHVGIISGYSDGTLRPKNYASVEETRIILSRTFTQSPPHITYSAIYLSRISQSDFDFYTTKLKTTQFQNDLDILIKDTINQKSLDGGTFSIYIKELNTGLEYTYNPDHIEHSASLAKLYLAAIIYDWTNSNQLDLDQQIWTPDGYQTIGHLTKIMIADSDNDAYNILFNYLGKETVSKEISRLGFTQSTIERNLFPGHPETIEYNQGEVLTSAKDAGKALEKIYLQEFGQYSELFLESLTDSIEDGRLPQGINYQVPVPHKIGTNNHAVHDAGIVLLEDNPYIIVIMFNNDNLVNVSLIEEIEREIAAKVFSYMQQ